MNITNWFKCKYETKNGSMPKYFVLDHNMKPNWLFNINVKKYNIIDCIKIKKFNQTIFIAYSKVTNHTFNCKYFDKKVNKKNFNIPILKSNLQKCIRRSKVKKSIKTANILITLDANELLRRLAIIYIEDCIIDKYFNYIIWYMSAVSKGYKLRHIDKLYILNIVKLLASSREKEELDYKEEINFDDFFDNINSEILESNYNTIWSLILRERYGGMKCDIKLILGCIYKYKNKYINVNNYDLNNPIVNKLNFELSDIILPSIDFHCSDIINFLLKKYKLNYEEYYDIYKKCIWYNRSSKTNKISLNYSKRNMNYCHYELYKCIKRDLDSYSKNVISKKFKI